MPARVLMVSPHFPPDSSAGAHRVRLLAPHLPAFGWEPTVVSIDPRDYEGRVDTGLERLVPPELRVIRCRAWSPSWTRPLGFGDLGLRGWTALSRTCRHLLAREPFDALFITIYPVYPALLGPRLKRRFHVPFILDYQDPWVGAWGLTVGGGAGGRVDLKSRASRALGAWLEPAVLRAADAITAVSQGTCDDLARRVPEIARIPQAVLPLGWERGDFDVLRTHPEPNPFFDPADGQRHLCYVGTLLPEGVETVRALLRAVRTLRERDPLAAAGVHLWFIGTSNQSRPGERLRVVPMAEAEGVGAQVHEIPGRIPYLQALRVLSDATGILLLGSTEPHYTASKIFPALLAGRPILALFHRESSVVDILQRAGRAPLVQVVTYGGAEGPLDRQAAIVEALATLLQRPGREVAAIDLSAIDGVSARAGARRLAALLDEVRGARRAA
ncbi:MAG: glycosyltransferase [Acidobacteriota bacterium]|nr:glycosyltransferase [Acidobacteriota bacterium]